MNVHFPFSIRTWRKGICLLVTGAHVGVFAGPAQTPLLTASSGPKPNIVLTLDDSGSMNFRMMPDDIGTVRTYKRSGGSSGSVTVYTRKSNPPASCNTYFATNPINPIVVAPNTAPPTNYGGYNVQTNCYDRTTENTYNSYVVDGTVALRAKIHPDEDNGNGINTYGVIDTHATKGYNNVDNLFVAKFRSPDYNGAYYNPDVVYKPWPAGARNIASGVDADGYPNNMQAVPISPDGTAAGTVNLQNEVSRSERWCASGMRSNADNYAGYTRYRNNQCPLSYRTFTPAVYFKKISGDGTSISHFRRYNVNSSSDFPNATDRAFQQKNFATWFTYYRSRLLLAKGAIALAFDAQPNNQFRLGFGSINKRVTWGSTSITNVSTSSIQGYDSVVLDEGVGTYNTTKEDNFFSWLKNLTALGGTPLRLAMTDVGEYYSSSAPYRSNPSDNNSPELSCRRNFHILVTDGYWNDTQTDYIDDIRDVDNADSDTDSDAVPSYTSSTLTNSNGTAFSYQYTSRLPFKDKDSTASKTLADISMRYWQTDLRPGTANGQLNNIPVTAEAIAAPHNPNNNPAFWQHMVNFTVGLGVQGSMALNTDINAPSFAGWPTPEADKNTTIDDLWHAAVNSRGKYLNARDPSGFANSLSSILASITTTGGTVSGVAVSRSSLGDNTLKFEPSFEPDKWSGELAAIQLNAETGSETSTVSWYASHKVPSHANRNIWMATSGSAAAEFTRANLTDTLPLGHIRSSGNTGVAPTINDALVNYLRGDATGEGPEGFRARKTVTVTTNGTDTIRTNVLGTMMNSVPRFVKGADFGNRFLPAEVGGVTTGSGSYNTFLGTKRARAGIVLIGANDGMLHGFRASDGVEMFGFLPKAVLAGESHPNSTGTSNLYGLARLADPNYEHQLYVDGQLTEGDVSSCSEGECAWKNIVVASAGGGAKSVFALDITQNFNSDSATEPSFFGASNFLWEYGPADDDLGYVMSPPEIGMLPSGKWVAVFGNGYDSVSGKAVLFIVDALTGALVRKIEAESDGGNGLGGVRLVRGVDNLIRHAYAGDLKGNVWKFDMTNESVDLGGVPLFTAEYDDAAQPIMATPNYALHPSKGLMVIVPTGKLYSSNDQDGGTQQTIYGLWDKTPIGQASTSANAIDPDKLIAKVVQGSGSTFSIVADGTAPADSRGWKLKMLNATGERGIYMPLFLGNGYTYVETVKPGQLANESCSIAEGSGYGYLINVVSGAQAPNGIVDINGDGAINDSDAKGVFQRRNVSRGTVLSGLPGRSGSITGDSSTGSKTDPLAEESSRYWRQIFWTIR
jgi:type IV pilus assembly protein PilY1